MNNDKTPYITVLAVLMIVFYGLAKFICAAFIWGVPILLAAMLIYAWKKGAFRL